jgi:homotetrameric cytidine deaminase
MRAARAARRRAYCPYSGFAVGAAVLGDNGRVYAGANVENASFGLTVCAERVAVFRAVVAGVRKIQAVAVAAGGPDPPRPCGACCQVLAEFAMDLTLPIVLTASRGAPFRTTLGGLFPQPFKFPQLDC